MLVLIHLDHSIQPFFECLTIRGETNDRQKNMGTIAGLVLPANLENLGNVARVDVVPCNRAGITGEDGEIGARDA